MGAAVFLGGLVALRGKPANGEPAATQPSRPEAANTTVKAVDDSPPTSTSTPPAARDAPPAAAPLDTLDFQTRWTTTWVNVREGRGASQPVVRVLNPGVSVQVRDLRSGWWHVYVDNQPVGYVGNSVLQREPPS